MTSFDFLNDPQVLIRERLSSVRLPRPLRLGACALVASTALCAVSIGAERHRLAEARAVLSARTARYEALHDRLVRERLEAGETADLGRLDGTLERVGTSGLRLRARLAELAREVPADVWLVSYAEDARRGAIVARTRSLEGVARALRGLRGARLTHVSRVERPGGGLFEFAMSVPVDATAP